MVAFAEGRTGAQGLPDVSWDDGMILVSLSGTAGCITKEAAALLDRNICRLSSGVGRAIRKIKM